MQSCTDCGAPITPKIGPPVLLNGNVVCQPCWQKSEAQAPAAKTPARAASGSSRAQAATRRTTGGSAPAATSRRHTSTTPAARRSSSRGEAAERKEPEADAGSGSNRATRTATLIQDLEKGTSTEKLKFYMVIVMCVLIIIAGVAGWMWYSKTTRDKEEAERTKNEAEAAISLLRNTVKKDPNDFPMIEKVLQDTEAKFKNFTQYRNEHSSVRSDVISRKDAAKQRAENEKLLEDLKRDVEDPSKRSSVRLLLERARLVANSMGKEYMEAVQKVANKLTANTLKDGIDAAKAKEASGDLAGALASYDESVAKFDKEFKLQSKPDPDLLAMYKEMLIESDKLVDRVETPEFEAQVPLRDMLSPKERPLWGKSAGAEFSIQGRDLEMRGVPVEGKKITGVVSFLPNPATPWHDLIMDLNFTLISGDLELYLRYWPDKRWFTIKFDPASGYELNKPYQVTLRVKGSKIELLAPDQNPQVDQLTVTTSRTGGVGFGLNPGSKVIISSCKVKVLRPKG